MSEDKADLNRGERFFRSLIENAFDAVVVVSRDRRFVYASPCVHRVLGYTAEEIVGQPTQNFAHPDEEAARAENFLRVLASPGRPIPVPARLPHKDGSFRDVLAVATNLLDDPAIQGIVVNWLDISERVAMEEELRRSRDELRRFAQHQEARVEAERRRMARDVHDTLGQSITALRLDLAWLRRHVDVATPEVAERLVEMDAIVSDTAVMVRRIASELRPGVLDELGLPAAIDSYVDAFAVRAGIQVERSIMQIRPEPPEHISTALYRIMQESLTNVARHGKATRVTVVLEQTQDGIALEVCDNGVGISGSFRPGGLGLVGMRERAGACGGDVIVSSAPGGGISVRVTIPFNSDAVRP